MTANITVVKPSRLRRLAATVALAALIAALVYLAISAIHNWYVLLASVVTLGVTVIAAWYILSRRGLARAVAVGVAALALVAFVVVVIISESLIVLAVGLGLAAVSVAAASYALHRPAAALTIERAPNPRHPVLLMNLKSGGGKAERFGLVDLCRQRGIHRFRTTNHFALRIQHGEELLVVFHRGDERFLRHGEEVGVETAHDRARPFDQARHLREIVVCHASSSGSPCFIACKNPRSRIHSTLH